MSLLARLLHQPFGPCHGVQAVLLVWRLFAIGAATVWAAASAFVAMVAKGHASLEDLLLLFIYLEIGSMVGIYFKTNHMPVRFLIYVGITALTRHLIVVVQGEMTSMKEKPLRDSASSMDWIRLRECIEVQRAM